MSSKLWCVNISAFATAFVLLTNVSLAANGSWNSTAAGSNAYWTNSLNWSASPYPAGNQTATFNNSGNGSTTIDLTGLDLGVSNIVFDTFYAGPYTLGSGGANAQVLVFTNSSVLRISPSVLESQRVDAMTLLGTSRAASAHTFRNDSPAATLTLAGNLAATNTSGTGGTKTVNIVGIGNVTLTGNIMTNGYSPLTLAVTNSGAVLLTGSNRINTVNANLGTLTFSGTNRIDTVNLNGNGPLNLTGTNIVSTLTINGSGVSVVDIGSGNLVLDNKGANVLNANQDCTINGTGKIWMSTQDTIANTGMNYADCNVAAGKTLVVNPEITGPGGLEVWTGSGTYVLNGTNTFEGHIYNSVAGAVISVANIGNRGSATSNLGKGTNVVFAAANNKLVYTGTGETSNRQLVFNSSPVIIDQSGSGKLVFSASPTLSSGSKTLTLQGSSAGMGEFSAVLANSSGNLSIFKTGAGTWIFSTNNTYSGTTVVDGGTLKLTGVSGAISASTGYTLSPGGTLLLDNTAAANNTNRLRDASAITLNGGTLSFSNDGGSATFIENAGALTVNLNASTIATAQAALGQTATLRFASLSRNAGGTVNFTGTGLGESARNRIFITAGTADGLIGPWATVNGTNLAAYSAANGVYASADTASYADIAARAPSTIVSNDTSYVRINTDGDHDGPIELGADITRVTALVQNTAIPATVNTASKTLQTAMVSVPADKASVTVGSAANDGTLTPLLPNGELALNNNSANALTINASIANSGLSSQLTKYGAGTATLAASNTFAGGVSILGGSLVLANSDALQYATLGTTGTVFDSSVVTHAFTLGGLTGAFSLPLADNAANPVALTVGYNNASTAFSGALSGNGSLAKVGSGTLALSGANLFTGGLSVASGTVVANNAYALGIGGLVNDGTVNLPLTGSAFYYSGMTNSMSGAGLVNVWLTTGTSTTYLNGDYSGFTGVWNIGTNVAAGASKVMMNGPDNAAATINILSNGTLMCAGGTHNATLILGGGDMGETYGQFRLDNAAVWAGPIKLAGNIADTANDGHFGRNTTTGTGIVSGVISDLNGPHPVAKIVSSTRIDFTATNSTFAGPVWVKAGTLGAVSIGNVGVASSLGQQANAADATIKLGTGGNGARLTYLGAGEETARVIDLAGTTGAGYIDHAGTGPLKFTSDLSVSGVGAKILNLEGASASAGEFAGVIANGAGSMISIAKNGTSTWTLSGANSYTGGTTLSTGRLVAGHPNALGTGTLTIPGTVATLVLDHNGVNEYTNYVFMNSSSVATFVLGNGGGTDAVSHALGDFDLGNLTLNVLAASNVVSGVPVLNIPSINLSAGGGGNVTIAPTNNAEVRIGSAAILRSSAAKNLLLDGLSLGNVVAGPISNGINTLSLTKANASTWTLYGSNVFSGATAVNGGRLVVAGTAGTLLGTSGITISTNAQLTVQNSVLTNHPNRVSDTATVTLNGGTFSYRHTGGAANYSETAGPLVVNSGSNSLTASQADELQSSVLTFASFAHNGSAAIDFRGDGLGVDDRNKVVFTASPGAGLLGLWATYNSTNFAAYDNTRGVVAADASLFTDIPALGPYEITNNATLTARITDIGTAGPLALQGAPVSALKALLQNTNTASTVGMTNQTLLVSDLMIAAGKSDLTLGTAEGEGLIMPLTAGGTLTLINQANSTLTLNAGVTNNTSASPVVKLGSGLVKLNGRNSYTGTTLIDQGSLEFGGGATQTLSGVISGAGTLVKSGNGTLTLSAGNTYTGPTTIKQGTVVAQNSTAFGTVAATSVVVEAGATLDMGGTLAKDALNLASKSFLVSGAGVNGMGALVNNGGADQQNALGQLALAGDTTFGGGRRWDLRPAPAALRMNGYTITKVSTNFVNLSQPTITPDGAGGTGDIDVQAGSFGLDGAGTRLNGGAANTLTVRGGARLELYNIPVVSNAVPWSLFLDHNSTVLATAGNGLGTINTWGGPVTLNGAANLSGNAGFSLTYTGEVAGAGSVVKTGAGTVYLTGINTYAGTTAVSNGTLYAKTAGSLPGTGTSRVTVTGGGTLMLPTGDGDTTGWTYDQIRSLYDANTFNTNTAALGIDTTFLSLEHPGDLAKPMALTKQGTNSLALQGVNTFNGALTINGGEVTMTAAGNHRLGNVTIGTASFVVSNAVTMFTYATNTYVGNAAADFGRMTLAGNAAWGTVLPIQNTPSPTLYVGNSGRGVLAVQDNAVLTNRIIVGTGTSGHGAIYQRGSSRVHNWCGQGNDGRIGENGYGYYELSGGTMTNNGYLQVGYGTASVGILSQFGGNFQFSGSYGGNLALNRGGTGVVYLAGGSFNSAKTVNLCETSGSSTTRGFADFTVAGTGDAQVVGNLNIADRINAFGIVNLLGGTLTANTFSKGNRAGSLAYVNFGGGTFRARTAGNLFGTGANTLDGVYVYPGGATFDSTNLAVTANASLLAPTGNGVSGITVTPRGGYIGPPFVTISGGGGTGATAIANFDSANGTVTGVTITCPGFGYTTLPTVSLSGGGTNLQTAVTGVTLAPNTSGGLTKQGAGTLLLTGTNTYGGVTTLAGGTLKPNNALAFPASTTFAFAGGTLDLNGLTLTSLINTTGDISGGITNGTLETVLSPAGQGVIGSQTFSLAVRSSATLRGTYFADVAEAGDCDLVAVQGNINLSNIALQIVNLDLLNRSKQYTILTCTGTRSGNFVSTNIPDGSKWHVIPMPDRSVRLVFVNGTLISLR